MPLDWKTPDMAQVGEAYSDILSASRLNQVPKAIDAIIKTVNDLQPNTTGDVTRFVYWTGEIVAKGPDGDADYTDSRYWVKMLAAKAYSGTGGTSGKGRNAKVDFQDEKTPGVGGIFTVTNALEVKLQSHKLQVGMRVQAFLQWNSKDTPYLFMSESTDGTISFFITGNAGGKAKYTATSFVWTPGDVDPDTDLDSADLGNLSIPNDCIVLNLPELGSSNTGHDVTNSNNTNAFSLYSWGRIDQINSDGIKVVHADMRWKGCT